MVYTLNKWAKNCCKWTILVQITIEDVVISFFWNTVYICVYIYIYISIFLTLSVLFYVMNNFSSYCTVLYCVLQSIFKGGKSCIGEQG